MSDGRIVSAAGAMTFAEKIRRRDFTVTCEIVPPKAPDLAPLIRRCGLLRGHVDAINITDCASAMVRMAPLAACQCVLSQGLEVIMQTTCRDRNRIGLQSDLIGAWALGVRHVMALTGDFVHLGDHPGAKPVFDLDSVNYLLLLSRLARGQTFSGGEIRVSPRSPVIPMDFTIGAAANPFGLDHDIGRIHLLKKIRAGAAFFQTQPIFDLARYREWEQVMTDAGVFDQAAVLVGLMPPRSARSLAMMDAETPGVCVPAEVIRRFETTDDVERESRAFMEEMIDAILENPRVAGIHFMPIGAEEMIPHLAALAIRRRAGAAPPVAACPAR